MSRNWRSHRFAPLSGLRAVPGMAGVEGFQQGLERGFREGLEGGRSQGFQEGLQRGLEEGRSQGILQGQDDSRARFDELSAPIEAIREKLTSLQADYEAALRKEVVELVARVARQVVRCELTLQPAQLLALVDEALRTLPSRPRQAVEVYLGPEDLERITQIDPRRAARWNLIPDPNLEPGECRIKSGEREVDAGCRGRLAACVEQVAGQLLDEADVPPVEAAA